MCGPVWRAQPGLSRAWGLEQKEHSPIWATKVGGTSCRSEKLRLRPTRSPQLSLIVAGREADSQDVGAGRGLLSPGGPPAGVHRLWRQPPTTTGVLVPAPAAQVQASGPAGGREGTGRPSRGAPGWGEPRGQGGGGEPSPGKAGPGAAWRGEDVGSLVSPAAGQRRS